MHRPSKSGGASSKLFVIGLPLLIGLVGHGHGAALAAAWIVGPDDPWCDTINSAAPGDEVIFTPGFYTRPCWITAQGEPGLPIVIRPESDDEKLRAVFAYPGSTSNVLDLANAAHLVLRGFSFAPTQPNVDAMKIRTARDIVIERSHFRGIGGISISANSGDSARITVRQNVFEDLASTALYFGCHNGADCHASDLVIEGNFIRGVLPGDGVGYGLQIKLNSHGLVRDNTIYGTRGPGIMVYGSNRGDPPSVVEGNYVEGSLEEAGINVGGGPAIVRNNVLVGNAYAGVFAQNYAGRDLQANVWIVHNTALDNAVAGIVVQAWREGRGNVLAFNALVPRPGTPAIFPEAPPGIIPGNVTCEPNDPCFVAATEPPYYLWPAAGGLLVGAAGGGPEEWRPADDFMGAVRGAAADVGAFQRTGEGDGPPVGGGEPRPLRE